MKRHVAFVAWGIPLTTWKVKLVGLQKFEEIMSNRWKDVNYDVTQGRVGALFDGVIPSRY